jgi:hypothetical protein
MLFPVASITNPSLPPSALVNYLDSLPTVRQQLSGVPIWSSCDPIIGGTKTLASSTDSPVVYVTTVPSLYAETFTHYVSNPLANTTSSTARTITPSVISVTSIARRPQTTRISQATSSPELSTRSLNRQSSVYAGKVSTSSDTSTPLGIQSSAAKASAPLRPHPVSPISITSLSSATPRPDPATPRPDPAVPALPAVSSQSYKGTGQEAIVASTSIASSSQSLTMEIPVPWTSNTSGSKTNAPAPLPYASTGNTQSEFAVMSLSQSGQAQRYSMIFVESGSDLVVDPASTTSTQVIATSQSNAISISSTTPQDNSTQQTVSDRPSSSVVESSGVADLDSHVGRVGVALTWCLRITLLLILLF